LSQGHPKVDISEFLELNQREKKVPWAERMELIKKRFPWMNDSRWIAELLDDPHGLGMVLQDVLKVTAATPGRDGPRATVTAKEGLPLLRQLWDDDYSYLPFHESFQALAAARRLSIRGIAAKTNINYGQINRYLKGTALPTVEEMQVIAKAFKKDPSYFYEYRIAALEAAMAKQMDRIPELSVKLYRQLVKR
jgi:hypothetical protein